MNRKRNTIVAIGNLACIAVIAAITGCGSDEPEAAPVAYTPPPPPPPPVSTVTPIRTLMSEMGIDERIELEEEWAPDNDEGRRAVLSFFDAFARGDKQVVASMLSTADRLELDALVESGDWASTTSEITRIQIQAGYNPNDPKTANYAGDACTVAMIFVGTAYQPQLWHFSNDYDEEMVFNAGATPPGIMDRLTGTDWIAAWFAILADELALADVPDIELVIAQKVYDAGGDGGRSSSGGGSGAQPGGPPLGPSAPGGGTPHRRPKKPSKRPPPGPGG